MKTKVCNSYWKNTKIAKDVEAFKQQPPITQQPQPPITQQPQPPSPTSPEFSSLATHNLINNSEVNPSIKLTNCVQNESTIIQKQPKTSDIIKIAENTIHRVVCDKTPLMVFNELVKDVTIKVQEHQAGEINNTKSYTATFEIDGKTYTGNHISKKQAKQFACASFLRNKFKNEMFERYEKNRESSEIDNGENFDDKSRPKGLLQEDVPLSEFSSLAMQNLIKQWEVNPSIKVANFVQVESTVVKQQLKTSDIIKIAENTIHRVVCDKTPLMVFNEMVKDVTIKVQEHQAGEINNTKSYTATFEIDGKTYTGNHISKKQAKQFACASFLRNKFENEMFERYEKNRESSEIDNGENFDDKSRPKGLLQEDVPLSEFSSLAMQNLIKQWEVNPSIKVANFVQVESTVVKQQLKTSDIIKIAENTIHRVVCDKTPLMVFNEMVKDVTIKVQEHQAGEINNTKSYTATFEIDGKTYTGNHISKKQAKQFACASFLRNKFENEMFERYEKNRESSEIDNGENFDDKSRPKGLLQEDVPLSEFSSLALHNFMNQWEVEPVVTSP